MAGAIVFLAWYYYNRAIMRMCPKCKVELKNRRYKGVSVDECENCHGIFFDRGELERAKTNADDDLRWLDFVLFSVTDFAKLRDEQGDCPKCSFAMEGMQYAGSSVIISKCPNCQGVWLDKGEFGKIVAYLENVVSSKSSAELADDLKHQVADVIVGPKTEVDEVKDLMALTRLLEERWTAEHPTIEKILATYYAVTPFK